MANKTKNNPTTEGFKLFEWVIKFKDKHGILNIITAGLLMVFMSIMLTVTLNPNIIFERWREYDENRHLESFNYRMKSTKSIQLLLSQALEEMGGIRSFVIELHNGKQNSSGLSFNYGSLTYEQTLDTVCSIREDYSEFSLDRYPLAMMVYDSGYWFGTVEELKSIDKRLAFKLEANDAYAIAVCTIYGIKSEIGFFGVTFNQNVEYMDAQNIANRIRKYSNQLSPFLDGDNIKYSE